MPAQSTFHLTRLTICRGSLPRLAQLLKLGIILFLDAVLDNHGRVLVTSEALARITRSA